MVAFGIGGERAAANIARIMLNGFGDERGRVGIAADKLGGSCSGEIDEIVEDENLAVALRARADADGGNGERGGDEPACLAQMCIRDSSKPVPARARGAARRGCGLQDD